MMMIPPSDVDLLKVAGFSRRQLAALSWVVKRGKKFLLYGGAMGGGKSYFLRWFAVICLIYLASRFKVQQAVAMLACEDYPSLKDRQLSKIGREFPEWLGKFHTDHAEHGRCYILQPRFGGGIIAFRNLDDSSKYQSAEFAVILVDELTKNEGETFDFLRTRLRWPGVPSRYCPFVGASNPGGVGHGWVKRFWIDREFPAEYDELIGGVQMRELFQYVPARAVDNPHLDEGYWASLRTLPEYMRRAFVEGDWTIFVGQAFQEWLPRVHVVRPMAVPREAPLYMTFDWGFGAPFSLGWWWEDRDCDRLYRFDEWYGWSGVVNQGLRLADSVIAEGIVERERAMGIAGRSVVRLAGPDCFQKRPNYLGGGQGPSTAEVFSSFGLHLRPGDPSRVLKKRQFHERLRVRADGLPGVLVYDTCKQLARTIPDLVTAKNDPEDIETKGEDHCYDEACHVFMARPMSAMEAVVDMLDACVV